MYAFEKKSNYRKVPLSARESQFLQPLNPSCNKLFLAANKMFVMFCLPVHAELTTLWFCFREMQINLRDFNLNLCYICTSLDQQFYQRWPTMLRVLTYDSTSLDQYLYQPWPTSLPALTINNTALTNNSTSYDNISTSLDQTFYQSWPIILPALTNNLTALTNNSTSLDQQFYQTWPTTTVWLEVLDIKKLLFSWQFHVK